MYNLCRSSKNGFIYTTKFQSQIWVPSWAWFPTLETLQVRMHSRECNGSWQLHLDSCQLRSRPIPWWLVPFPLEMQRASDLGPWCSRIWRSCHGFCHIRYSEPLLAVLFVAVDHFLVAWESLWIPWLSLKMQNNDANISLPGVQGKAMLPQMLRLVYFVRFMGLSKDFVCDMCTRIAQTFKTNTQIVRKYKIYTGLPSTCKTSDCSTLLNFLHILWEWWYDKFVLDSEMVQSLNVKAILTLSSVVRRPYLASPHVHVGTISGTSWNKYEFTPISTIVNFCLLIVYFCFFFFLWQN